MKPVWLGWYEDVAHAVDAGDKSVVGHRLVVSCSTLCRLQWVEMGTPTASNGQRRCWQCLAVIAEREQKAKKERLANAADRQTEMIK